MSVPKTPKLPLIEEEKMKLRHMKIRLNEIAEMNPEDLSRLIAYTATHMRFDKQSWDFTKERKAYRSSLGYPEDRPPAY